MPVTIYHNPKCGTSRNTLALIQATGETPTVIEYLKTPPSRAELVDLIARAEQGDRTGEYQQRGRCKKGLFAYQAVDDLAVDDTVVALEDRRRPLLAHPVHGR